MADLTITAANVVAAADAKIGRGTAGAAITAGQSLYLDSADGRMKLADANSGTAAARSCAGIALHAASSGQPIAYAYEGDVNPGATLTVGEIYVLSATAGGIAPEGDLTTGHYVGILGVATTASNLRLRINNSGVAVP